MSAYSAKLELAGYVLATDKIDVAVEPVILAIAINELTSAALTNALTTANDSLSGANIASIPKSDSA